jgi:hypothetical protein
MRTCSLEEASHDEFDACEWASARTQQQHSRRHRLLDGARGVAQPHHTHAWHTLSDQPVGRQDQKVTFKFKHCDGAKGAHKSAPTTQTILIYVSANITLQMARFVHWSHNAVHLTA